MTLLEELLKRTGCAEELETQPHDWEELMTAVAAGAIDYDETEEVVTKCVALADHTAPREPTWDEVVSRAVPHLTGDLDCDAAQTLIACGKAADRWSGDSE